MTFTKRYFGLLSMMLLSGLLWMAACESDLDPMDDGPSNNPGNPLNFDPDEVAEYLVLTDASKVAFHIQKTCPWGEYAY